MKLAPLTDTVQFDRLPYVLGVRGRSRASHYNDIGSGLWARPVKIGARASAWPRHETSLLNAARIAGKSDAETHSLVSLVAELEAARKTAV